MTSARPGSKPGKPSRARRRHPRRRSVVASRWRPRSVGARARATGRTPGDRDRSLASVAEASQPCDERAPVASAPDPTPRLLAEARVHVGAARATSSARLDRDHSGRSARPAGRPRGRRLTAAKRSDRRPRRPRARCCPPPMSGARRCRPRRRRPTRRPRSVRRASSSPLTHARTDVQAPPGGRQERSPVARLRGRRRSRPAGPPALPGSGLGPDIGGRRRASRSAAAGASVPRAEQPLAEPRDAPGRPTRGDEPGRRIRLGDEKRGRCSCRGRCPARSRLTWTGRGASEERGDGGPERVEPDWLLDDRVDARGSARVCGSTRPGHPVTRITGTPWARSLRGAGDLEPGAARQHEVGHHEIDRLRVPRAQPASPTSPVA